MGSIPYVSLILLNLETRYWMRNGNSCFWVELSRGWDSVVAQRKKKSAFNAGDPGQEDPLEKGMATHSSILAWRMPWTEEHGGLYFMGSQRIRHD